MHSADDRVAVGLGRERHVRHLVEHLVQTIHRVEVDPRDVLEVLLIVIVERHVVDESTHRITAEVRVPTRIEHVGVPVGVERRRDRVARPLVGDRDDAVVLLERALRFVIGEDDGHAVLLQILLRATDHPREVVCVDRAKRGKLIWRESGGIA